MAKKPIKETTQKMSSMKKKKKLLWYRGESLLEILHEYPILRCSHKVGKAELLLHQNNPECWYKVMKKNKPHTFTQAWEAVEQFLNHVPPFSSHLMQGM